MVAKTQHRKDEEDFFRDLLAGNLPIVSVIKPIGADNEQPAMPARWAGQAHATWGAFTPKAYERKSKR